MIEDKIIAEVQAIRCITKAAVREVLEGFLGHDAEGSVRHFGSVPTDQLQIISEGGKIVALRWWTGLKWTPSGGYGSPSVEVSLPA